MDHVGVVGGGLRCQVSVVIQEPLGRILAFITVSEEPKKGAKRDSRGSMKRAQGTEQIRSLFLDPLGTYSTCMPHTMKMWMYS